MDDYLHRLPTLSHLTPASVGVCQQAVASIIKCQERCYSIIYINVANIKTDLFVAGLLKSGFNYFH